MNDVYVMTLQGENWQLRTDWLAMLRHIAKLTDDATGDVWGEVDDDIFLEQFDPWQALVELKAERDELLAVAKMAREWIDKILELALELEIGAGMIDTPPEP